MGRGQLFLLVIGLPALLLLSQPHPVYACSGPPTPLDYLVRNSDYLIYARVLESDAAGQNHVVRIAQYYTGGAGPAMMMVTRNGPEQIQGLHDYLYGNGDCNSVAPLPPTDAPFYMFVERDSDGYYHQQGGISSADFYVFPTPDATVTVYLPDPAHPGDSEYSIGRDVTEAAFLDLVAQFWVGSAATPPDASLPEPTYAPLLITTATGTRYILPVDGGDPVPVDDTDLALRLTGYTRLSDLGAHYRPECRYALTCTAALTPGGAVRLLVDGEPGPLLNPFNRPVYNRSGGGDEALFAPTGVGAIWTGEQLEISGSNPITLLAGESVYGPRFSAWSDDGTLFAYSDGAGLWLVDAMRAETRLLIATGTTIPTVRRFSPSGRYLLFTDAEPDRVLDLVTGRTFGGTALAPDERRILWIDNGELLLQTLPGLEPVGTGMSAVVDAAWVDAQRYVAVVCPPDELCTVEHRRLWFAPGTYEAASEPGSVVTVSDHGDVAVLVDTATVSVNRRVMSLRLDDAIGSIRWLPSRFYTLPVGRS